MTVSSPPRTVLLTGAIGSGKSLLCAAFARLGVPCLDTDALARAIHQDRAHPATRALASAFPQAMTEDGRLARGSLRSVFAADPAANARLKQLLGPSVLAQAARWVQAQDSVYVIVESALAADLPDVADRVLVADAPDALRRRRIAQRNPDWPAAQVQAVMALQPPRAAYLAYADDMIVNDGEASHLHDLALQQHRCYQNLWSPA
jgi:dephospho-CoA kinase